jgi:DNA-binding transcriptional regulator YdaS (Cro superfamily)
MNHDNPLQKAVSIVGLKPLASAIDVKYQAVQNYLKSRTPAEKVIGVSEATEWKVTPHQLRPDLYPHPMDGLPDHLRLGATVQDLPPAHGPGCCARQTALST